MPYNVAIKAVGASTELIVANFSAPPAGLTYKVYNGSAWVSATAWVYNGTTWEASTPQIAS